MKNIGALYDHGQLSLGLGNQMHFGEKNENSHSRKKVPGQSRITPRDRKKLEGTPFENHKQNVLQLFSKDSTQNASRFSLKNFQWFELIVFSVFAALITQYLVRESAIFYLESQESSLSAYSKAIVIEGTGILFSFSYGRSVLVGRVQKALVILFCLLTLFTMSNKLVSSVCRDSANYRLTFQVVKDLEAEKEEKGKLRNTLVSREWIGAVQRYDRDLDSVRLRLGAARQKLEGLGSPTVSLVKFGLLLTSRILFLVANLVCIHRMVELIANVNR